MNSMKTYDKLNTLIVNNWDLNAIEKTIRQLYPKSYHSSYLDDYRRLIDAHQNSTASNKYDFSQLFDDNSMDQTTETEVDDNYWTYSISDSQLDYPSDNNDFVIDVLK